MVGVGASNKIKTKLACILEAGENHCRLMMKTILQEEATIHYSIILWFTN